MMRRLLTLALVAHAGLLSAQQRPQLGVAVQPDTVTVGDAFRLVVRVRAERGAAIEFPTRLDSIGAVEALDPVVVLPTADTSVVEQTATYRLAAWDIGLQSFGVPDVVVRDGAGEHRVSIGRRMVFVKSVLPADSAQRIPKPARDVLDVAPPWWWWLVLAAAALAVALLLWAWWRRRRRRAPVGRIVDPLTEADAAFARIERLGLVAAGERARHAALMVEVLRDYLARVVPAATGSLTTAELLTAVRDESVVPSNTLAALLAEADLVKFARKPITTERALGVGTESRDLVHRIDHALHAPKAQEAA